jgi:hypothetical protein
MTPPRFPLPALAGLLLVAPLVASATSISLLTAGSALVSADTTFQRTATASGSGPYAFQNAFGDTTPLNPASNYTGPTFYGGYSFTSSTINTGITRQQIRNDRNLHGSTVDSITLQAFRTGGWDSSNLSLHGAFLFQESIATGSFSTEQVNGINLTWAGSGNAAGATPFAFDGRFIVRMDGAYYVSETVFSLVAGNGSHALSGPALATERWALHDPAANLDFDQSAASFSLLTLAGVDSVGLYFENDLWSGTSAANAAFTLELTSFGITTTPIPEPSAWAALLGAAALAGASTRRRRPSSVFNK